MSAQTGPGGGIWGPDGSASGELIGPGRAGVSAGYQTGTPAQQSAPRRSDGQPIVCTRTSEDGAQVGADTGDPVGDLEDEFGEVSGDTLMTWIDCTQGGRSLPGYPRLSEWAPGEDTMSPEQLMEAARALLEFPPPSGSTTPPLDPGTVAQLPTFFQVDNWAPVSEEASAGPVTATVTATPVRQTWDIHDSVRDTTYTVACEGPGVAFDPASGDAPPAGACQWTPPHSSAGQTRRSTPSDEPCFEATVTIAWAVAWDSNVGEGGSLGEGTSSSTACLVVGEVQAVVTEAP